VQNTLPHQSFNHLRAMKGSISSPRGLARDVLELKAACEREVDRQWVMSMTEQVGFDLYLLRAGVKGFNSLDRPSTATNEAEKRKVSASRGEASGSAVRASKGAKKSAKQVARARVVAPTRVMPGREGKKRDAGASGMGDGSGEREGERDAKRARVAKGTQCMRCSELEDAVRSHGDRLFVCRRCQETVCSNEYCGVQSSKRICNECA
jgi:hypothetical protein